MNHQPSSAHLCFDTVVMRSQTNHNLAYYADSHHTSVAEEGELQGVAEEAGEVVAASAAEEREEAEEEDVEVAEQVGAVQDKNTRALACKEPNNNLARASNREKKRGRSDEQRMMA